MCKFAYIILRSFIKRKPTKYGRMNIDTSECRIVRPLRGQLIITKTTKLKEGREYLE